MDGTQSRTMMRACENCQFRNAPHTLFSLFSYTTQNPLPRNGTTKGKLGLPTSISNQDNTLKTFIYADFIKAFST